MKRTILGFLSGIAAMGLLAMTGIIDKKSAEVQQVQGLYIFVKSTPELEYEVIGTVKGPGMGSHEFDDLLNQLIKRAKKDHPSAEGIVFDGPIKQTHNTTVSVIKFK